MLPYKSLSFSTLEGRHGVYALIDKSERNKEMRKSRPSVRADIKQALDKVINECNQYGNFLSQVFTITNVKELSAEEVEEIIKKNGGNSQASH